RLHHACSLREAAQGCDHPAVHNEPEDTCPDQQHNQRDNQAVLETDDSSEGDVGWPSNGHGPARAIHWNVTVEPVALLILSDQVAWFALQSDAQARDALQQISVGRDSERIGNDVPAAVHHPDSYLA